MVLQYDLDVIADRSPFIAGQTFKRRLELGPHAQQLGGTFGALAVMPINGNLVGATAPAPELQKVYYYNKLHADSTGEPTAVATTVAMLTTLAVAQLGRVRSSRTA